MALRQPININQENIHSNIQTKAVQPTKGLQVRSALGEVGNKLASVTANGGTKKTGVVRVQTKKAESLITKDDKKPSQKTQPHIHKGVQNLKKAEQAKCENKGVDNNVSNAYSSKQFLIIDPDESSKNEPQMVTEYIADIFAYLRSLEDKFPIRQGFLRSHDTTPRMRTVLVNWLAEVAVNFKLQLETLHLGVTIVDRYLQETKSVGRSTLQLIGTAAMFVACKYEEMYIPELSDFVYICDDTFSSRQILLTEMEILKKLDFSFGRPYSILFLRRYSKVAQAKSEHHTLGKYILELALMEYELSHVKPSIQAAAACCLSIGILNEMMDTSKIWTPTMEHYTTYKLSDFRDVMITMAHMLVKAETSKFQMIRSKYAGSAFGKISVDRRLPGPLVKKLTSTATLKK